MQLTNIIKKLKKDRDKRKLLENFISLSILQSVNYILPLVTLPYLVRVLGPEKFGLIAFAQSFMQYFVVLTDFGFNLSATREVAIHRDNKEKLSEIFSSVMTIKFVLLMISFMIMSIIVFSFEKFRKDWLIFYFTFGVVVGQVIFPVWFFQGMEKMKYITFLNVTAKLIFTLLIFVLIHKVSDYIFVPLINSFGFLVSGFLAIWIITKDFKIKFYIINKNTLIKYLKSSFQFFLSRVSVSLYTSTNTFILGLFTTEKEVGYYSIAERLYLALQQFYHPLVNALYPYVAHKKNIRLFKNIFKACIFTNIIFVSILFIFSNKLIELIFGIGFEPSAIIFKIFLLSNLVVVPSILLGYPFLAALGFANYANISVILGSFFHLLGLAILLFLNMINIYSVAFMVIITETLVFIIRLYGIIKHKLWRLN